MTQQEIKQYIRDNVFQNTDEKITGQALQNVLISLVEIIFSDKQVSQITTDETNINITYTDGITESLPLSPKFPDNVKSLFDIGYIKKDDDLSNLFVSEVFIKMLTGETHSPIIEKFYIQKLDESTIVEDPENYVFQCGEPIKKNAEIKWEYSKYRYKKNSTTLYNLKTNERYFQNKDVTTFVMPEQLTGLTTPGEYPFKITLYDTSDVLYENLLSLKYGYNFYYGNSLNTTLSVPQIKLLTRKGIYENFINAKLSLQGNGYKYFIIDENIDTGDWYIHNTRTNFEVPIEQIDNISFSNDYGIISTYNVYRTIYSLMNPINIQIKLDE